MNRNSQRRSRQFYLVFHFGTGVNVVAHVVRKNRRLDLIQFLRELNFSGTSQLKKNRYA